MTEFEVAKLMVDAAIVAGAIASAQREQYTAAVLTALHLVRIRGGDRTLQ